MITDRLSPDAWRARFAAALDVTFVAFLGLFAYVQLERVVADHVFTSLPFAIVYTLLIGVVLMRRHPARSSGKLSHWLLASTAWLPLAMLPEDASRALSLIGVGIASVGGILTVVALGSLGRSFGIAPADRGIRVNGAYGVVRHPLYAAESLAIVGNLMANPSGLNAAIVAVVLTCIPLRIAVEERLLSETEAYRTYKQEVLWRLIPGLY